MLPQNTHDDESITIRLANWPGDAGVIRNVRRQVFIMEQQIPEELEWDHRDADCEHALADLNGSVVATGRLLPDGHIGRMAVLKAWRGQHIGSAVLEFLITRARHKGLTQVGLSSQIHALAFYQSHGFIAQGPQYLEAGILHQDMRKVLKETSH